MSSLIARANNALKDNPTVAVIDITTAGSDFLWMVFSVMAATTLGIGIWCAVSVPRGSRVFHHLSMMITATASVAYFCMASDLGATPIGVEFVRGTYNADRITRSIWYVRYIDWTVTTPLLLLELLLVTGLPLSDIVITIFADEVMIVTGLVGALVESQYKWGLFSIGCFAMLYVFYQLYFPGRQSTHSLGSELSKTYLVGAGILSFLWFLYPIAWGLAGESIMLISHSYIADRALLFPGTKMGATLYPQTEKWCSTASWTCSPSQSLHLSTCGHFERQTMARSLFRVESTLNLPMKLKPVVPRYITTTMPHRPLPATLLLTTTTPPRAQRWSKRAVKSPLPRLMCSPNLPSEATLRDGFLC
jgi:bacteriorhodopsin